MTVIEEEHANATGSGLNDTHTNATVHLLGHASAEPTPILFIFACCCLGAIVRTILKKVRLPYTAVLLVLGGLIGVMSGQIPLVARYTTVAGMDPHTILHVFLPVLIFESAFAMEVHTFLKSMTQIVILAIPGLGLSAILTAVFCMHVFTYNWGWTIAIMFGAIVSATDPVAVVALLKELGASKQLAVIIEGESLLNDGAAMVLFQIFQELSVPGVSKSGLDIFLYFIRVALGGPAWGYIMGKITILWLRNIFNDALTEITITLASTYMTFYIGEAWLGVSGVLSLVVVGITVSAERTSISPEVEAFLHRFWEMLAYLANTLIFILVGVVITERAISDISATDGFLLAALYLAIFVIRGLVIGMFSPLLRRIGYGLSWRSAAVMTWGGLRGAVGLALGLIVSQNHAIDPTGEIQSKILLHSAGIVMLTLLVNATTVSVLLRILGMSEMSLPKRMTMASAVRNLQEVANNSINIYRTDRFLADADWDVVKKYIDIQDPYQTTEEEAEMDELTNFHRTSKCPGCEHEVPNQPSAKELQEMMNEARLRLLKAQKTSYWKQFEHGMLSREAVRRLVEFVDNATDKQGAFVSIDEIKKNWQIRGLYAYLKERLEYYASNKPDEEKNPMPLNKGLRMIYRICVHQAFDIILNLIILLNVAIVIFQLVVELTLCKDIIQAIYGDAFDILNYIFIFCYIMEAVLKIAAFQVRYFKSKWNLFDFVILLLSILDLVLDWTVFRGATDESEECQGTVTSDASTYLNPNLFKMAKVIRLLRLLRSLRLVKGLIPQMIEGLNQRIYIKLRMGYDVGKGYITGEEEVHNFIDLMIDNRKIAKQLKEVVVSGRLELMKELGLLQKNYPGIAVSIKTQQATRRILNNLRDKISGLRGEGVLDEAESGKLEVMVEMRMKKLLKIPPTIQPPPPEKIVGNLTWVAGDPHLMEYFKCNSVLVTMQEGEELNVESDPKGGIYVIISGLVKVDKYVEDHSRFLEEEHMIKRKLVMAKSESLDHTYDNVVPSVEKVSDYLSTGSVLGELSLLTTKSSNTLVTCATSVQMYHITYDAIQAALELFTESPSLEYRLWKVAANRIAAAILKKQMYYRSWPFDKIKLSLEKCIIYLKKWEIPEGGRFTKPFVFDIASIHMSDIVLVHGYAENPDTGEILKGPCYVPARMEALHLLPEKSEKHVLCILPRDASVRLEKAGAIGAESMASLVDARQNLESRMDDLVRERSDLCLQHASQERHRLEKQLQETKLEVKRSRYLGGRSRSLLSASLRRPRTDSRHADYEAPEVVVQTGSPTGIKMEIKQTNLEKLPPLPFVKAPLRASNKIVPMIDVQSKDKTATSSDKERFKADAGKPGDESRKSLPPVESPKRDESNQKL